MAETKKSGAESQAAGQGAEGAKKKKKHTGASIKERREKLGKPAPKKRTDVASAKESADNQVFNARSESANGRSMRCFPQTNRDAWPSIREKCAQLAAEFTARGLTRNVVAGAGLIYDRLGVNLEVASLTVSPPPPDALLTYIAFLSKRREALLRILPGPSHAPERSRFGFNGEQLRAEEPLTIVRAAEGMLAGIKAMPESRAARMLAGDEKTLREMIRAIQSTRSARRKSRSAQLAHTTERDLLNCALELFYDEYAACAGLVLEGDEVARIEALELVPRREERRDAKEETTEGNPGNSGNSNGSAGNSTGSVNAPAQPAAAAR